MVVCVCVCVCVSVCRLMFLSWTVPYLYHLSGVLCADCEGHLIDSCTGRGVVWPGTVPGPWRWTGTEGRKRVMVNLIFLLLTSNNILHLPLPPPPPRVLQNYWVDFDAKNVIRRAAP